MTTAECSCHLGDILKTVILNNNLLQTIESRCLHVN